MIKFISRFLSQVIHALQEQQSKKNKRLSRTSSNRKPSLAVKKVVTILAILCSLIILLYFGWTKWFSAGSKPVVKNPIVAVVENNGLLGGSYYEISVLPTATDAYLSADYRIWIPKNVQTIRGLLVRQHGCGDIAASTGLDYANDLQWQALALKHQFALLGTQLPTGKKVCEYWALVNYGSGKAFLKALHAFAEASHHPELEQVPWALWGHSGGADWVAQMLQEYPDRTIAMVGVRGGGFLFLGSNPALAEIPVLFAAGEKDPYASETLELPKQVFLRYRKMNVPWTFAVEANTGHECGDTRLLAVPYLDAIISARMTSGSQKLKAIEVSQGWFGNINTLKVAPTKQYTGNTSEAAWLPNEETAHKWQEYVTEGKIAPTRQPAAPTEVRALRGNGTEVVVTWNYMPDLENGLPSFHIYRNKSLIATVDGQSHSFDDAPKPATITLQFIDKGAEPNTTYTVAAFNSLGESVSKVGATITSAIN